MILFKITITRLSHFEEKTPPFEGFFLFLSGHKKGEYEVLSPFSYSWNFASHLSQLGASPPRLHTLASPI